MAQSGVDTCTHGSVRFGELCVGVANITQNWDSARSLCESLELRLPSLGEAEALATHHDLPAVGDNVAVLDRELLLRFGVQSMGRK